MGTPASVQWISTLNLLGAAQGFFLAMLLASKHRRSVSNTLLAVAMLTFSVDLLVSVYHARGLAVAYPAFIGITYSFPLLYGPLVFFYANTLTERRRALRRADWWHFAPFALLTLGMVPFFAQSGTAKLAFLHTPDRSAWSEPLTWINHVKFVHSFAYLALTVGILHRHRQRHRASSGHNGLAWLRHLMYGIVALWLLSLGLHVAAQVEGLDPIEGYDDYAALAVTVFVYTLGYVGLRKGELFDPLDQAANDAGADAQDTPRYARSGMDGDEAQHHVRRLAALMVSEKPYRNSGLTLQELAARLSLSPHNLSEVINTQLDQNFYDFVNGYRVREVQERLADPASAHLTLLAIGLEAGFNSKSSFNAVFKKHTRMTPSAYRRQVVTGA